MRLSWFPVLFVSGFVWKDNEAAFASYSTITTSGVAGGPVGVGFSSANNKLIIAGHNSNKLRIDQGGAISEISGTSSVPFVNLYGVWLDPVGNIFAVNQHGHNVFIVSVSGQISVIAGTGTASSTGDGGLASLATLNQPTYVWGDANGNLFVAEQGGNRVRKINKSDNKISTVAGNGATGTPVDGGLATQTVLNGPVGVYVSPVGDLFISSWGDNRIRFVSAATGIIQTLAGAGGTVPTVNGVISASSQISQPCGLWGDSKGNVFVANYAANNVVVIAKENNYEKTYIVNTNVPAGHGIFGDEATGRLWVTSFVQNTVTLLKDSAWVSASPSAGPTPTVVATTAPSASPSIKPSISPSTLPSATPSVSPTRVPTASPSSVPSAQPSQEPTRVPTASPSTVPSVVPSAEPSIKPTSAPSVAPTLAVPEYSLTVSAKSFKYFEFRVFTEANERVLPVSYDLVDCSENADAVIWGHESTPITEDTNTCVYGLPRHYWCECPALLNGNKPKLTLNFGGTVFDRVELLILDWVDGEVVVSDSANNIVLFSASRAGGPLVGEEFVGYDHLNLLQVAPSVVPTVTPSSAPTTKPSWTPTTKPTIPSIVPTQTPTMVPTTTKPSAEPSVTPSMVPSAAPSFTAQYTITLTAKTFKYFEVRVYTHDNLRIFPVSYELEHCPENAGVTVWNEQTTEDTNTCVYGYPRNFWCACSAVADAKPKLVLHMGHTVFDRVELLLLNWEDGEVTVTDEANHETLLSATHDGVGNEFVTFGNLNLEHAAAAPVRRLLRGG